MGFLFAGNTGETQDSLETKRKLALAMLARGTDTSPIQSKWQGAARLADAVLGGMDLHKQDVDQKDADAQSMALITGTPYTPPPQSGGFLSSLFGANKVPASDAQGQVAAASPPMGTPKVASAGISASPDASDLNAYLSDPSKRSTLPAGMRNNNPGNIKFVGQKVPGIVGPSQNTDEGDPQAVFDTPEDGMAAMHSLLLRKYDGGKVTADQIIAGQGGWTPGNHEAAANVARYAGISPSDNINLHDPAMATKFMRGLMMQEHGKSSGLYPDAMIASVVGGRPAVAPGQVASLDPSAGMGAPQQAAYVDPQVVTQQPSPAAQAIQQQAPLPGPGGQMPPQDPQQTASVGPMQPPQAAPPMAAPVNIPNQPISNPMPADLSGVGMGGSAPGPGQFPPAPANPQAQLAAAMQGAPQQPQQANPQQQLAQAMQSAPVAPNPMRDNPRVQQLMRAMSNPNASPQMRAMVGAALQQEMSRGEDAYKLQLDAYQKQQDPQYQATLKKAQYEADHLGQVSPDTQATVNADPTSIKEYNLAKSQGYPGTFTQFDLEQKAAGRPTTTINNGDNSSKFQAKADEEAATRIGGYVSEGANASQMLGDVQQLADLGKQINTGKGAQVLLSLGPYAESLGIDIKGLGPEQAFNSIVSRLAPSMRPTGSGSSSDTDVRMFLQSLPSLGNTPDGNAMIASTLASVQQHKMAAADIASKALVPKEQGGISWQEAESQIRKMPNPYQGFNEYRKTHQAGDAAPAPAGAKPPPAPGTEEGGYRFKGGDPSDPKNWEQSL